MSLYYFSSNTNSTESMSPSEFDTSSESPGSQNEISSFFLNKRLVTNLVALTITGIAFIINEPWRQPLLNTGLFALSGALTNWLAIYMLFERIPGLYGSGVVPLHFKDFKIGIHDLVMNQFFNSKNFERFYSTIEKEKEFQPDFSPLIEKIDLNPTFDSVLKVIEKSHFAPLLALSGGGGVLESLRAPFLAKMRTTLKMISESEEFHRGISIVLSEKNQNEVLRLKVSNVVQMRLDELTPGMVKDIVEGMIAEHLGWLVVWGGVFGGLIGLLSSYVFELKLFFV